MPVSRRTILGGAVVGAATIGTSVFALAENAVAAFNGYYRITARHSGKALAVQGASTSQGANVIQWVYFQDTGTVERWNNFPQTPQKQGILRNLNSPVYKGSTAIEARQTYINEGGGYHSETVQHGAQLVGTDYYYGQAIYLPANWQFHNQNATFQQWSPENPSGPWELMFVQNDDIRFGGPGGISGTAGKIARGAWTRIVARLKLSGGTSGAFEVWVNGVKTVSLTGRAVLPHTANSIRWSSGIYCTAWRDGLPAGQQMLSIFHDHARIAATYQLAEPANW